MSLPGADGLNGWATDGGEPVGIPGGLIVRPGGAEVGPLGPGPLGAGTRPRGPWLLGHGAMPDPDALVGPIRHGGLVPGAGGPGCLGPGG